MNHSKIWLRILFAALALLFFGPLFGQTGAPAFPGAEGAGKFTSGGRGGKTIAVTNLNDSGPGSLRAAVEARGPRTVVFRISGTIALESPLVIENDSITIAGQTAPGDGICLRNYPLHIAANNVIVRYIRARLGDVRRVQDDAASGTRRKDIIIDHCSFSWSVDECASFYDNENFTMQWCIVSESMNQSLHEKGNHGYGGIWGGMNATFHHNLIAHHTSRLPRFQGSRYHGMPEKEKADFINNVVYNWTNQSSYGGERGSYNLIANYYKPGPATPKKAAKIILTPYQPYGKFYLKDNFLEGSAGGDWEWVDIPNADLAKARASHPFPVSNPVTPQTPEQAFREVLEHAGASLSRDAVDRRVVDNVRNGSYTFGNRGIIDSQEQTGGWPELKTLPPPKDSDGDGMPDDWESAHGLNPHDPEDRNGQNVDELYTNLEVYINSLAR